MIVIGKCFEIFINSALSKLYFKTEVGNSFIIQHIWTPNLCLVLIMVLSALLITGKNKRIFRGRGWKDVSSTYKFYGEEKNLNSITICMRHSI